ncbi:MAG TPA: ATP-binding protein [Stenomitos sp.]
MHLEQRLARYALELVDVSGATGSAIWLWDPSLDALQIQASCRLSEDYVGYGNQSAQLPEAKDRAPVYLSYKLGSVIQVESPLTEVTWQFYLEGFQHLQVRFLYTTPVTLGGTRLGTIALYFSDTPEITELGTARIQAIVAQVAAEVSVDSLYRQLRENMQELEETNALLRQSMEKMRETERIKNDFLNAVSHELRTPLTSIVGYSEFLEDGIGGPLNPAQLSHILEIQRGARRLEHLVDDLLDFARLEAGTFKLLFQDGDLAQLLNAVTTSLRPQAVRGDLKLEAPEIPGPVTLRMDTKRIEQVLLNLIGNAIKFTPPGGRVGVTIQRSADEIRVEVTDTGIGIAAEDLPRIFQKFFQVDPSTTRSQGGAGLGLAIAKSLIEAHGGQIGVTSRPGRGSRFWFALPLLTPATQPPAEATP